MTRSPRIRFRLVLLAIACSVLAACRAEPLVPRQHQVQPRSPAGSAALPSGARLDAPGTPAPGETRANTPALARRDLRADERRGGHTIARHVARSDGELRDRLRAERISAASTYHDLETAERVVALTVRQAADRIAEWEARAAPRPNLALRYRGDRSRTVGRSIIRGRREPIPCHDAVVVLRWDAGGRDYYVLTSYPEARDDRPRR